MAKELEDRISSRDNKNIICTTQQEWTNHLSSCRWCASHSPVKGNRAHATLFCSHPLLASYRSNMTSLIESKLHYFINQMAFTYSDFAAKLLLQNIEATMIDLHGIGLGKEDDHTKYRTRSDWMREEEFDTWTDLSNSNIPIYSMIFGFVPVMESSMPSDKDIKIVNCIPFGLIPTALERQVHNMIKSAHSYIPCQLICKSISAALFTLWSEIKDINIKRIVGIHRIIGNISKSYESEHCLKYKIEDNLMKKTKEPLRNNRAKSLKQSSILRRKPLEELQNRPSKKRKKVHFELPEFPRKLCSGISCNRELSMWNERTVTPHLISPLQKHCSRCSRQSTAVRKCISILDTCKSSTKKREKSELISFLDSSTRKLHFKKAKTLLSNITDESKETTPNKINDIKKSPEHKSKCTDAEKQMIKVLSKSLGEQTSRQEDVDARLQTASTNLNLTFLNIDNFLKDDLKRNSSLQHQIVKDKSYNQKDICKQIITATSKIVVQEKVWCSNNFQSQQSTSIMQVANYNQLVGGNAINLAIMNLRFQKIDKVYIGNAATSSIIATCNSKKDWHRFSPCFGDTKALFKPHGIYLLPIFSEGHWFFIMIDKQKSLCRGWVIDSLGTGAINSDIANRVKKIFSMARRKCSWITTKATRQTELECGPRTICGMVSICNSVRNGTDIQEAVRLATSLQTEERAYSSMRYRTEAKEFMNVTEEVKGAYENAIAMMIREKRRQATKVRETEHPAHRRGDIVNLC